MTKPRLLIVDDDEDIRTQMKWALAEHYDVMRYQGDAGRETIRLAWRDRLVTLGAQVRAEQGPTQVIGWAEDVTEDGALIVRRDDGSRVLITWGDVSIGG